MDRDLSTVGKVGLDEKSFLRDQSYVTTLCDLEKVRVIEVVEGRKEEDARRAIATLPEAVRVGMRAIAMDMWPAFINAAGKDLPGADVVFDRFHVSQHMGEAVDAVRRHAAHEIKIRLAAPIKSREKPFFPSGKSRR